MALRHSLQNDVHRRATSHSTLQMSAPAPSVPVDDLLSTRGTTPSLSKLIREADTDGSGTLSLEELVKVFQKDQRLSEESRLLRK